MEGDPRSKGAPTRPGGASRRGAGSGRGRGLAARGTRDAGRARRSRGACSALAWPACVRRVALRGSGAAIMSTAMNFGSKSFQPRPPDKGSFPLDHFGERRGPGPWAPAEARGRAGPCGAAGGPSERLVRRRPVVR